jgi:hypothetical protein
MQVFGFQATVKLKKTAQAKTLCLCFLKKKFQLAIILLFDEGFNLALNGKRREDVFRLPCGCTWARFA